VSALAHRRATGGSPSASTAGVDASGRAPVVLLHGFTQTSTCWAPVDEALAGTDEVVALDLPGHGASSEVRADLWTTADLVAATLADLAVPPTGDGTRTAIDPGADAGPRGPVTLLGYSMGGRVALHVALAHPDLVQRLVLVGATPGIEDDAERAARRTADEALADRIEAIGVPAFLDEWLALPLFAGLAPEQAHRPERMANTAAGLASSLRLTGTGTQEPLWDRLGELTMPTLLVTGALDPKFTNIARRMLPRLGGPAEHVVVPDAGHTAHLEQPDRFSAELHAWLDAPT
jgi:2-succinyl-6-hydroxy-2,4-cyclohexadiene-1-carboxylate synthase